MKKRNVGRMLGTLALSCALLTSEMSVVYGAQENIKMGSAQAESLKKKNVKKELLPFEEYMKKCWKNRQERIDISAYKLTDEAVMSKLSEIRLESPEFWWATRYHDWEIDKETGFVDTYIQFYSGTIGRPLYRDEELEREWEIVQEKTKYCKTDLEKAIVVHEHLVDTVDYSVEPGDLAHEVDGAIFEKQAVCEGYALAYKYYMNRLGIPCKKMSGDAAVAGGWMKHGWDQVQLNGKWYLVDPTWDDPEGNYSNVYHTYLLRSEYKFDGHRWDRDKYEPCTDTTYDAAPWAQGSKGLWGYQGGIYYSRLDIVDNEILVGIWRCDAEDPTKEPELLIPIKDQWSDNQYGRTETAYYDGALYYNTPRAVYKWNFNKEDAPELVFELEDDIKEEIYNVEVADGKIYYDTALGDDGQRTKHTYVIDPNYQRVKHPIAVTDTTMTVDLHAAKETYLQSAAPGAVTYTSKNPEICDVKPVYKDESCQLIPKKAGRTVVTVSAEGTDHYLPGSVEVEIIVKDDSSVEENIILNYEAGEHGSLKAVKAGTDIALSDGQEIEPNTEVRFTATPKEGYVVKNWIVNGNVYKKDGEIYTGKTLSRVITSSNDSVKVEFVKEKKYYQVSAKAVLEDNSLAEDVKITLKDEAGNVVTSESDILEGTKITAEADCPKDMDIVKWVINDKDYPSENTISFVLESDTEVKLVVKQKVEEHTHVYDVEKVEDRYKASDATCTEPAKYYKSCACGERSDVTFSFGEALGHDYGEAVWNWSSDNKAAEAVFTCSRDKNHVEKVTAEVTGKVAKNPTCTEQGETAYTAKVTFGGKVSTDTKTVKDIPKLGHDYGEAVWNWSSDNKTAEAVFTCGKDKTHVEKVKAEVTSKVTKNPTCTEQGETAYTAKVTFGGKVSTDTKTVKDIPKLGHDYGEAVWNWSSDNKTAEAVFTCRKDKTHVEKVKAEVTSKVTKNPTCTEQGETTYTAKVTFGGKVSTDTKTVKNIQALGHKFEYGMCSVCGATDPNYKKYELADSTWTKGDEKDVVIEIPAEIGKIAKVTIDGKDLEKDSYIVAEGTLTIKSDMLEKLMEGQHSVQIRGEKGYAELTVTIEKEEVVEPPKLDPQEPTEPSNPDSGKPTNPTKPNNQGSDAQQKPTKPDNKNQNTDVKSAKTGDNSATIPLLTLAGGAMLIGISAYKKREKETEE